jgi:hypothetical protein
MMEIHKKNKWNFKGLKCVHKMWKTLKNIENHIKRGKILKKLMKNTKKPMKNNGKNEEKHKKMKENNFSYKMIHILANFAFHSS